MAYVASLWLVNQAPQSTRMCLSCFPCSLQPRAAVHLPVRGAPWTMTTIPLRFRAARPSAEMSMPRWRVMALQTGLSSSSPAVTLLLTALCRCSPEQRQIKDCCLPMILITLPPSLQVLGEETLLKPMSHPRSPHALCLGLCRSGSALNAGEGACLEYSKWGGRKRMSIWQYLKGLDPLSFHALSTWFSWLVGPRSC